MIYISPNHCPGAAAIKGNIGFKIFTECAISVVKIKEIVLIIVVGDEEVQIAVIVKISPGAAVRIPTIIGDDSRGNSAESLISVIPIKKIILPGLIGYKQIQVAIVIIIPPASPHRIGRVHSNTTSADDSGEIPQGIVAIKKIAFIVGKAVSNKQIEIPVVVKIDPITPLRSSAIIYRGAVTDFRKSTVTIILI